MYDYVDTGVVFIVGISIFFYIFEAKSRCADMLGNAELRIQG